MYLYKCTNAKTGDFGEYLDTGNICIVLAADQDILELQLYNEYGFKVHAISCNMRLFSSKLKERKRNYNSLICTSPFFKGP